MTTSVNKALKVPLDATEQEFYAIIRQALLKAGVQADASALASAIINLQPDLLEQALLTINIDSVQATIREAITAVINRAGIQQARQMLPLIEQGSTWGNGNMLTGHPDTMFTFDIENEIANYFAEQQSARLVTAINDSMRLAIRQIIAESFSKSYSVDFTAERLRQVIGLHPRWAKAVDRFFNTNYERLIKDGVDPIKALKKVSNLTGAYHNRLIEARATMIARTEIQMAQNWGRQLAWQQGVDGKYLDPQSEKQWITASATVGGVPPCDRCAPLEGVRVRWDMAFPNGLLMPPAHPHCRCTAFLVPPSRGLNDNEFIATGVAR